MRDEDVDEAVGVAVGVGVAPKESDDEAVFDGVAVLVDVVDGVDVEVAVGVTDGVG